MYNFFLKKKTQHNNNIDETKFKNIIDNKFIKKKRQQ